MAQDKAEDCVDLVADCRARMAMDLFTHVWDPIVLAALNAGPRRRRALRTGIGGISAKVLTDALHRLIANGLVERRSIAEAPPRGDYALTPLGRTFADGPMRALAEWVTTYGDELFEALETMARSTATSKSTVAA